MVLGTLGTCLSTAVKIGMFIANRTSGMTEAQFLKRMENVKKAVLDSPERERPYLERRAGFKTKLTRQGKSPQDWDLGPPPPHLQLVTYSSGHLNLRAILYVPPNLGEAKRPALVYYHGGFALDYEDMDDCQPFVDDDFVVMMPMLRAKNNGEDHYELFGGEIDAAAWVPFPVRFLWTKFIPST